MVLEPAVVVAPAAPQPADRPAPASPGGRELPVDDTVDPVPPVVPALASAEPVLD